MEKEIKKALIDKRMTVTQLASSIGMSRTWVSNVINGHFASPKTLKKIVKALGLTLVK